MTELLKTTSHSRDQTYFLIIILKQELFKVNVFQFVSSRATSKQSICDEESRLFS